MNSMTFPAVEVRFDFKNDEWALTHLPNVRIATLLLQQDDNQLTETMRTIAADPDHAADLVERLCGTKEHLEALVDLLNASIARVFIALDRLGDQEANGPADRSVN